MHLLHSTHNIQKTNPASPDCEKEAPAKQNEFLEKKIQHVYQLALQNKNDIKGLKKQHEEMSRRLAQLNESVNNQLFNFSSLFSNLSLQSTSSGIQLGEFLQSAHRQLETSRRLIEKAAAESDLLIKLSFPQTGEEGEKIK